MPLVLDGTTGIAGPLNGTLGATTPNTVAATTITASTPIGVANGGTGAATLTANNVLLGNGTSAVQVVAPGTSGNVLTSNGTTWSSTALPAGGVTSLNGQTGAITNTSLYAIGSYVNGRGSNENTTYAAGDTLAGSSLYSIPPGTMMKSGAQPIMPGFPSFVAGANLVNTGTWRAMTPGTGGYANGSYGLAALWVRIS